VEGYFHFLYIIYLGIYAQIVSQKVWHVSLRQTFDSMGMSQVNGVPKHGGLLTCFSNETMNKQLRMGQHFMFSINHPMIIIMGLSTIQLLSIY
jgi:hypothetical protein